MEKVTWIEQKKRILFLEKYPSLTLQKKYEDCTTEDEIKTMKYPGMVDKAKNKLQSSIKQNANILIS